MALRSALRKMPALGLSSFPIGPRMGLVRALSLAAPSRHFSQANLPCPTGDNQLNNYGQGQLDYSPEAMNRMHEEYNKERVELRNSLAELDKIMEMIEQNNAQQTGQQTADLTEIVRGHSERISARMNKRLNKFVAAQCGFSALVVIGTMYKHSLIS